MMNESIQAILRDQRLAWQLGQKPLVESFIEKYPFLQMDQSSLLDLICGEYFLRFDFGDRVEVDAFCQRFPTHAEKIKQLLYLTSLFCVSSVGSSLTEGSSSTIIDIDQSPKIPGIRFVQFIAKGTWGIVFEGIQERLSRRVAVKVLQRVSKVASQEEFLLHESKALAKLNHPNVVQVYDSGIFQGHHYIVMEFVDGMTLKSYLAQKGPLPVNEALRLLSEIADGISAAHQSDVIHRDLKPANILLNAKNQPKIVDFGLARLDDNSRVSNVEGTVGTFGYMAPEQLKSPLSISKAVDIYAIGVIFHVMITGDFPRLNNNHGSRAVNNDFCSDMISRFDKRTKELLGLCLESDLKRRCESAIHIKAICLSILEQKGNSKIKRRQFIASAAAIASAPFIGIGLYQIYKSRVYTAKDVRERIISKLIVGKEYDFKRDGASTLPFVWLNNESGSISRVKDVGDLRAGCVGKGFLELLDYVPINRYRFSATIQIDKSGFLDSPYAGAYWGLSMYSDGSHSHVNASFTNRSDRSPKKATPKCKLELFHANNNTTDISGFQEGPFYNVSQDQVLSWKKIGFELSDSAMKLVWKNDSDVSDSVEIEYPLENLRMKLYKYALGSMVVANEVQISPNGSIGLFFNNCTARVQNIILEPA